MKTNKYIVSFLLCFFVVTIVAAQQISKSTDLSFTVTDAKGSPLKDVVVTANEGSSILLSSEIGEFSVSVKPSSVLVFEKEGYELKTISATQILKDGNKVILSEMVNPNLYGKVNMPFQVLDKRYKSVGDITAIDVKKEMGRDTRLGGVSSAITGKVSGVMNAWNIYGIGTGVTIVDGVERDASYLNLQEIEQITVLKDASSRMLYGSEGRDGVFLITTKKGAPNKKHVNFDVEYGMQKAISYPKYLNSADYMTTYNQAYRNDGNAGNYFNDPIIANTRTGVDPVLYPDNDYYGNDYVRDMTNFSNVYGEISGGNEKVQYFINLGWKHNEGWIKKANQDYSDLLNIRSKVNFTVNDWLKMKVDVVAVYDMAKTSVDGNFWQKASSTLPNTTALLLPIDRVTNMDSLSGVNLINNKYLLGGTSVYQTNLLADMTRTGYTSTMNRYCQYNTGFDLNLGSITPGLTGTGLFSIDFRNYISESVANTYAVYERGTPDSLGNFNVTKIGNDNFTTRRALNVPEMTFDRSIAGYFSLNYNRTFGKNEITAVALGRAKTYAAEGLTQNNKRVSFGAQANYIYDDKYILNAGFLTQGSSKMAPDNRFATAPSFGLGWIATNENFLKDNSFLNFLKLRATYGSILNDNWGNGFGSYQGYFLHESVYKSDAAFNYNNGNYKNNSVNIASIALDNIKWQRNNELVAGFDMALLNNQLWVEASYFDNHYKDLMTLLLNSVPSTMGIPASSNISYAGNYSTLVGSGVYANYNSLKNQGVELGVNYSKKFNELTVSVGANFMYYVSKYTKFEEPDYSLPTNRHLSRVGTSVTGLMGLTALGLYKAEDFDANGNLNSGAPTPTYAAVQPGDVKYLDYNNDGQIDDDDRSVLGLGSNNKQLSLDLDLKYKGWQFYVLGIAQGGGKGFTNGDYYWFTGNDAKYSEMALKAYDPENPTADAVYPRLTLGSGTNNYRSSTLWMYDKSYFDLSALQLGYNFKMNQGAFVKGLKCYLRGSNLMRIAKDRDIQELNIGFAPQNRVFALGLMASF